jgi:proline racemase
VHGIMGAVTIGLERGLIDPGGDGRHVTLDTVAGTIRAEATVARDAAAVVEQVSVTNVPSFVLRPGLALAIANRRLRADVAFGGRFYAIVDSEAAGVSLEMSSTPELRRVGRAIAQAADASGACAHPADARVTGIHGTVFTSPPREGAADLRTVTVLADGSVDRSAGGTAMSAVMAVLDAMGLLSEAPFTTEGVIGTTLRARRRARTTVGGHDAIVPVIEGRAWIIGDHRWYASDDDPLAFGWESSG